VVSAGDVLLVHRRYINPAHDKFVICVDPGRDWFFFINSNPRRLAAAQVPTEPYELRCLDHRSWVDTSKIVTFSDEELIPAKRDRHRHKGPLSPMLRLRIKAVVQKHTYLPAGQAAAVNENL